MYQSQREGLLKRNLKEPTMNPAILGSAIFLVGLASLANSSPAGVTLFYDRSSGRYFMPMYGRMLQVERSDHEVAASSDESANYSGEYGGGNDYSAQVSATHHSEGHVQADHEDSGFQPSYDPHQFQADQHQGFSSFGSFGGGHDHFSGGGGHDHFGGGGGGGQEHYGGGDHGSSEHGYGSENDHNYVHSVPVSEHVEVTKPVPVPVYKEIGIPVPHPVKIHVPHPVAVGVPQPYPVAVPVSKPFPVQIIKTIAVPVEKKVPYPVEKHIPVPVEKPVPITIERHIPVPVEKPYPIKIPVYKTIYHHSKSHGHGHGHGR